MSHVLAAAERRVEAALRAMGVGRVTSLPRAVRAVEFGAVGATGGVVNTLVFAFSPVAYLFAGLLAFASGTTWTFALNWTVTYDRPDRSLVRAFGRYASVYVTGLVVYLAALVAGVEYLALDHLAANVLAVAAAGLLNFAGAELYALTD